MLDFTELLSGFFTDCREAAFEELRSDEQYAKRISRQVELLSKLESLLTPEILALLDDYNETMSHIRSLECNKSFLCGLTLQATILRRFDITTPEYESLMKNFLQ